MRQISLLRSQEKFISQFEVMDLNGKEATVQEISKSKNVIFNFVLGTWCPLCIGHIVKITQALESKVKDDSLKIILISTESSAKLRSKVQQVKLSDHDTLGHILVASDSGKELLNIFKIKVPIFGFAKPATFLLDIEKNFHKISQGIPNSEQTICDLTGYFGAKAKVA